MKNKLLLLSLASLTLTASTYATLIYEQNFDSLTPGPVTTAQLAAAAPGGGWFFPARAGTTWTIEADASGNGDLALKVDDSDATGNAGTIQLVGLNLSPSATIDLTTLGVGGTAQVNFQVASARSGLNKHQLYRLADVDGNQALDLRWQNDGTFFVNDVSVGGAGTLPTLTPNLDPWNSTSDLVYDVNITIAQDGTVNGTFEGVPFASTFNGRTTIDRFQYHSSGTSAAERGGFINNLTFETFAVPEPSTAALVSLGLVALALRRRR